MAYAELTDVRCDYQMRGRGDALLLIPGLGSTNAVWDPILDDLSQLFTLIMPNNRGVGQSRARRHAHSLQDFAADYLELLDHLQVETTHVLGLSFGGMVAQWFAHQHPARVKRLVLVSTAHQLTPYLAEVAQLLGQALYRLPRRLFERTIELLQISPVTLDADPKRLDREVKRELRRKVPGKEIIRQLRCIAASVPDLKDYVIHSPTLVVSGEYDALIPHCYGRRLADDIPGSRFLMVRGVGHNIIDEAPQRIAPMVATFLATGALVAPDGELDAAAGPTERSAIA